MTIRFLQQWNGYSPDQIVSGLGTTEEARMVSLGFATTDLDGPGTPEGELARIIATSSGGVAVALPSGENILLPRGHVTLCRNAATAPINYNVSKGIIFDQFYDNSTGFPNSDIWNGSTDLDALIIPAGVSYVKFTANIGIPTTFVPAAPDLAASIRMTVQNNYVTIPVVTPAIHIMFIPPTYDTTGHLGIASTWIPTSPGEKYNLVLKHEANAAVAFAGGLACYLNAEFK